LTLGSSALPGECRVDLAARWGPAARLEVAVAQLEVAAAQLEVAAAQLGVAEARLEVAMAQLEVAVARLGVAVAQLEVAVAQLEVAAAQLGLTVALVSYPTVAAHESFASQEPPLEPTHRTCPLVHSAMASSTRESCETVALAVAFQPTTPSW
jgi:outer membrane protein TolC